MRNRYRRRLLGALAALGFASLLSAPSVDAEASRPRLGDADEFAVIADQSITNAGATSISGSVAIAASSNLLGFPPGIILGETHLADATALDVAGDTAAVNQDLKAQPCNSDRSGQDQGGLRLGEMVYCYNEPATLDGELRMDALNDLGAVWVFQIRGSYDVAAGSKMILANGAQACNVFWQVTGSMTVGDGAQLVGTFLSDENIVLGQGVTLNGRVWAPQGSVTMDDSSISQSACASSTGQITTTTTSTTPPTTDTTVAPTPTTAAPTPTSTPTPTTTPGSGTGDGSGTGSGTGTGTGTGTGSGNDGDDGGLANTGPVSMIVAALAMGALSLGHALVGTERAVRWNKRRWRPRHAAPRLARLRRRR
jgi:hypothetical protein